MTRHPVVQPDHSVDEFRVLFAGYVPPAVPWDLGTAGSVASTVAFIRDGSRKIIVDPGFVPSRSVILDPLAELGYEPEDITDVVFSHHHPDHTFNVALFPNAQAHDVWGIYRNDQWTMRPAEGFAVAPGVKLIETPGHSPQDITTLVGTDGGLVALTHLWWTDVRPPGDDTVGTDQVAFHESRDRVLAMNPTVIVPGHGPAFAPTQETPR
jgi:glyoxylase-like metal-dependent hydrolase (beta-lactamase superfamily II)